MAEPSEKSEGMEQVITRVVGFDRRKVIREDKCVPQPFGCGGDAKEFKDEVSRREYRISGLCQKCQDKFFGEAEE